MTGTPWSDGTLRLSSSFETLLGFPCIMVDWGSTLT